MKLAHSIEIREVILQLNTNEANGLSFDAAVNRIKEFGANTIAQEEQLGWWIILIRQFKSPIVYLLLFAAATSFYFNEWLDASAIVVVIFVNAIIGFYMEFQAGRSMDALKKLSAVPAKALRNGKLSEIDAEEIVPGDIVFLEAGDMVPADGRILKLSYMKANESALTGESLPVEKTEGILPENSPLPEQGNMVFKGTFITNGNAWAVVTATGMNTELGRIASLVQSAEQAATPLEKKLEEFSKKLIVITVVLVFIIFLVGWLRGRDFFVMLNTSIALAVAAIPEGLPIVATLALARGMLKMAKHRIIVKKLSAVETLGGTSVICTDKTGTLTENKMTVREVIPSAEVSKSTHQKILKACILCNTANIDDRGKEVGDPLEIALLNYAGGSLNIADTRLNYPKVKEEPFSSESKRMLTTHRNDAEFIVYAKGAVEEILRICTKNDLDDNDLSEPQRSDLSNEAEKLASAGYKVIALAYKKTEAPQISDEDMVFLGVVGLIDPPRRGVTKAIAECKSAGIKVVMITGDHPRTAMEIANQLGLLDSKQEDATHGSSMKKYDDLSEDDKVNWINSHVFARVTPVQKLDLIKVYQEKKYVVGMTGDGVNDAPALKKADIGIAMGLRGTQVAQDVADMVLKDDSFSSIVKAIKQGRIIFDNIRKFVIFLLSCNLSELFTIAVTAVFNLHFQLFPLQILFINIITDVLPALALGMTPGNAGIMNRLPRDGNEPIIGNAHWRAIIFYSIIISAASLGAVTLSHYTYHNTESWNPALCNNILFFTLIVSQLLHVLNMNSFGSNFFRSEIIRNKYVWYSMGICILMLILVYEISPVRTVLGIYPLRISDWTTIICFCLLGMIVNQLAKALKLIKH